MQWYATYMNLISGRQRGWWPTVARSGLWLLSGVYCLGAAVKNFLYDRGWLRSHRVSVPVISIGNLTTGGTGKSPLVHWFVNEFQRREVRVGVVSRGYGDHTNAGNDEAAELHQRFPSVTHIQNRDRVAACRQAVERGAVQIIVADDGFQHRRLYRNLDLVVIDATQPWGYGACLPRGLMRESIRGLRRADLALISRAELVSPDQLQQTRASIRRIAPQLAIVTATTEPQGWINGDGHRLAIEGLSGRRVLAFAGIGNPQAFCKLLQNLGIDTSEFCAFPDHHAYSQSDWEKLQKMAIANQANALVCTRKDLVKLTEFNSGDLPIWALDIGVKIVNGLEEIHQAMDRVLEKLRA